MNNRKRMILKSVEVCYKKGKIDKCTKRMDLAYAVKEFGNEVKDEQLILACKDLKKEMEK